VLANAFLGTKTRFCVVSFTSDWLFPTRTSRRRARAERRRRQRVSFVEIETDRGHDAFLLDEPEMFATIRGFLSAAGEARASPMKRRWATPPIANGTSRVDLLAIADWSTPGSRVLDVGCGDGTLLPAGATTRGVDGRGIEISQKGVNECVARGLSVIQGDADTDLVDYPDDAFDYVILSQTLQATHRPRHVVEQMLRIGRQAIVSFPNFGHWRCARGCSRLHRPHAGDARICRILVRHAQHPFLHDPRLRRLCGEIDATVETSMALNRHGQRIPFNAPLVVLEPVRTAGGVPARRGAAGSRRRRARRRSGRRAAS
jgi:methionine biosynthesis protein MetW